MQYFFLNIITNQVNLLLKSAYHPFDNDIKGNNKCITYRFFFKKKPNQFGFMKIVSLLSNYWLAIFFRYSIDRHTDLERYFIINAEDGNIKTIKALDREEIAWHNISVFAVEVRKYFTEVFCNQCYKFCRLLIVVVC